MAYTYIHPSPSPSTSTHKKSKFLFLESILKTLAPEVQYDSKNKTSLAMIGRAH